MSNPVTTGEDRGTARAPALRRHASSASAGSRPPPRAPLDGGTLGGGGSAGARGESRAVDLDSIRGVLDEVLALVRDRRGVDFRGYRRSTIERRLLNRILSARAASAGAYLCRLRDDDGETDRLIACLTVKVSRFFRNAAVFDALWALLRTDLRARFAGQPLRLWSAGCGHGEEAFTLAMLLGDAPGEVWGTDIDTSALATAADARYGDEALRELPAALATQCLAPAGRGAVTVRDHLRRRVRFVRHDLAAATAPPDGAPFHLVCCRNVVIYFQPALQRRALRLIAQSVVPGGVLCLGEAEWEGGLAGMLEPIDRRRKLYRRAGAEPAPR